MHFFVESNRASRAVIQVRHKTAPAAIDGQRDARLYGKKKMDFTIAGMVRVCKYSPASGMCTPYV